MKESWDPIQDRIPKYVEIKNMKPNKKKVMKNIDASRIPHVFTIVKDLTDIWKLSFFSEHLLATVYSKLCHNCKPYFI